MQVWLTELCELHDRRSNIKAICISNDETRIIWSLIELTDERVKNINTNLMYNITELQIIFESNAYLPPNFLPINADF